MKIKSTEAVSDNYLHINSCGCEIIKGFDGGSLRPDGRCDYHILYIAKGRCTVIADGKKIPAMAGSVVVYLPYQRQEYYFSKDDDTKSYYIHFSGTACKNLIEKFGMNNKYVYNMGYSHSVVNLFNILIETFRLKQSYYDENCQGILLSLLSIIGKKIYEASVNIQYGIRRQINEICRDIYSDYSCDFSVSDFAKRCNLSKSRFSHVFTLTMGISPGHYVIRAKIDVSKEFLKNTDYSVLQIANNVGFESQNYFSRIFKKYTGLSPSDYRKKHGDI